jgi:hypothetical protein
MARPTMGALVPDYKDIRLKSRNNRLAARQ